MNLEDLGEEESWWCHATGLTVTDCGLGLEMMSNRTENAEHEIVHVLMKLANSPHLLFFMSLNSLSG